MSYSKEKKSKTGLIAGISAALAAGAVYLFGPEGDKHRRELKGWALKTRGEVLERLENLEEVSKDKYYEVVDAAIIKFAEEKAERSEQVEALRERLKGEWEEIKTRVGEKGEDLRETTADFIADKADEIADDVAPEDK